MSGTVSIESKSTHLLRKDEMPGIQSGSSIWYGPDMAGRTEEWLHTLTPEEIEELKVAVDKLVSLSPDDPNSLSLELLDDLKNFELTRILSKIPSFTEQLHDGRGFFVWRGIPVETWNKKQAAAAFLIIGKCLGNIRQQNPKGHVLGHVVDLGHSEKNPNNRLHNIRGRITFHADSCDVSGLLSLNVAKSGGESLLVSTGTIYNEMMKTNPDLTFELFQPMAVDRRGDVVPGKLPYYFIPVFTYHEGYLSAMYQRQYTESAQRFPDVPKLTPSQIAAHDLFDSLANDPLLNFGMKLLPGDMQFINNHVLVHDRTIYEDWPEPELKRHLYRIWLATPTARPLPPISAGRFGSIEVGARGGFNNPGVVPNVPIHY